jgi:hypothetical protein
MPLVPAGVQKSGDQERGMRIIRLTVSRSKAWSCPLRAFAFFDVRRRG